MTAELRTPVAIRITRPYATEDEYLEHELDTLTRASITLVGAQPRAEGVVLRFELVLSSGQVLLRGEGRVIGFKPNALNGLGGLALRFTRLDTRSKTLVDKAAAIRERRRPSFRSPASDPPPLPSSSVSRPPMAVVPSAVPPPPPLPTSMAAMAPPEPVFPTLQRSSMAAGIAPAEPVFPTPQRSSVAAVAPASEPVLPAHQRSAMTAFVPAIAMRPPLPPSIGGIAPLPSSVAASAPAAEAPSASARSWTSPFPPALTSSGSRRPSPVPASPSPERAGAPSSVPPPPSSAGGAGRPVRGTPVPIGSIPGSEPTPAPPEREVLLERLRARARTLDFAMVRRLLASRGSS